MAPAQLAYERAAHYPQWSCIACAHSYDKCSGLPFAPLLHPGPVLVFASGGRPIPARHTAQGVPALGAIMQA
jgi:hypothetical protein